MAFNEEYAAKFKVLEPIGKVYLGERRNEDAGTSIKIYINATSDCLELTLSAPQCHILCSTAASK